MSARPGRRISARVFTLVGIGMLAPLGVMAWAGWSGFGEFQRRITAERELVARSAAERLTSALGAEVAAMDQLASRVSPGADEASLRESLRSLRGHRLFDSVFVIDARGEVVVREPAGPSVDPLVLLKDIEQAGRPTLTDLRTDAQGRQRLYALAPLRGVRGEVTGLIGGEIDPSAPQLAQLLEGEALGPQESVDVLDGEGYVLASTDVTRRFFRVEHSGFAARLIHDRRSSPGQCHGCHGVATAERELIAFVPVPNSNWGVIARQPRREAFAFADALFVKVVVLALVLLALALLFAWGAALSVTRPVKVLTQAAVQITDGELSTPIPPLPRDEVGQLGAALETMREALRASRDELEQRVQDRTAELERLNATLQDREAARTKLLRQLITAREDERKRIARELHDETAQSLAALSISLESTARSLPAPANRSVEEAAALAVRTLDEVRRLIVDLRPSVLDDLGLESAILWYADRCLKPKGVSTRCEFSGLEERLPQEYETALFRTVQEAMTNIARHAEAETVLIQCTRRGGQVTLEIEDDGQGFDNSTRDRAADSRHGFGLMGMRERVELLGGTLSIDSEPGQGTHLTLTVPLPEVTHG